MISTVRMSPFPFQVLVMISDASLLYLSISQAMSCLLHGILGKQRLIFVLGLDECFLEKGGI